MKTTGRIAPSVVLILSLAGAGQAGDAAKLIGQWARVQQSSLACQTQAALDKMMEYYRSGEADAALTLLYLKALNGECGRFEAGNEVFVHDISVSHDTAQVHLKGDPAKFWIPLKAVGNIVAASSTTTRAGDSSGLARTACDAYVSERCAAGDTACMKRELAQIAKSMTDESLAKTICSGLLQTTTLQDDISTCIATIRREAQDIYNANK